jgi:hypothetical protein
MILLSSACHSSDIALRPLCLSAHAEWLELVALSTGYSWSKSSRLPVRPAVSSSGHTPGDSPRLAADPAPNDFGTLRLIPAGTRAAWMLSSSETVQAPSACATEVIAAIGCAGCGPAAAAKRWTSHQTVAPCLPPRMLDRPARLRQARWRRRGQWRGGPGQARANADRLGTRSALVSKPQGIACKREASRQPRESG